MADDAGALLVRSGLVSPSALEEARSKVDAQGGTLGEQLVATGAIADDALTDFYRSRLLVPQVNPNTLARLPIRVVATIPSDMAIELRAIPVALDGDNNLTVAMSDPSDRHAVDEIAFFTGAYVVRAVATQLQIAWCLAHYYGHVTALGQRLLMPSNDHSVPNRVPLEVMASPSARLRGVTDKVDAARHVVVAPGAKHDIAPRPRASDLDTTVPTRSDLEDALDAKTDVEEGAPEPTDEEADATRREPTGDAAAVPEKPRGRSISGEIRVPGRRAASIKPPPPADDDDDTGSATSGAVISIEVDEPEDTGPAKRPPPRRRVKTDPPELAARAGEVDVATGPVVKLDLDEVPRIIVDEDELAPPAKADATGEIQVRTHRNESQPAVSSIEVTDDSEGVVIHAHRDTPSEPVLLERRRRHPTDVPTGRHGRAPRAGVRDETSDVVVLESRKTQKLARARTAKSTHVGTGVTSATRTHRDTETSSAVPGELDDAPTADEQMVVDPDQTRLDARAAPPRRLATGENTDETLAPPPSPRRSAIGDDSGETLAAPPAPTPPRAPSVPPLAAAASDGVVGGAGEEDDEDPYTPTTSVMSAVELDEAIPDRTADVVPAHIAERESTERRVDYDPLDDGWGPPGTTIPPPLLGAIPGSDDEADTTGIPVADTDSAPLIVAPPRPPEPTRGLVSGGTVSKALEDATARVFELIRDLETARDRDEVVRLMVAHLADSHQRAGFFSIKPDARKVNELTVFTMQPSPQVLPQTALRLDRPSTLQDVVGTRLPYRGPTHDEASRIFLTGVLGQCPAEILLVPVAVRERVVGVLFGEHRLRHTFDDQLALAARAAGIALERILKAKRG